MFCVHPGDPLGMLDTFPFRIRNVRYKHILQYVLCQRAVLADDHEAFRAIRNMQCHKKMLHRAQMVSMDTELMWEDIAYQACVEAARVKYNGACQHELMVSGQIMYICDDVFWGTAGSEAGVMIGIPFRGQNVYGKVLSKVRQEIVEKDAQA